MAYFEAEKSLLELIGGYNLTRKRLAVFKYQDDAELSLEIKWNSDQNIYKAKDGSIWYIDGPMDLPTSRKILMRQINYIIENIIKGSDFEQDLLDSYDKPVNQLPDVEQFYLSFKRTKIVKTL